MKIDTLEREREREKKHSHDQVQQSHLKLICKVQNRKTMRCPTSKINKAPHPMPKLGSLASASMIFPPSNHTDRCGSEPSNPPLELLEKKIPARYAMFTIITTHCFYTMMGRRPRGITAVMCMNFGSKSYSS